MKPGAFFSRRIIVRAALLLLLGALINVAVAWTCSSLVDWDSPVWTRGATEEQMNWWRTNAPIEELGSAPDGTVRPRFAFGVDSVLLIGIPPWPSNSWVEAHSIKAGLPMRCVIARQWYEDPALVPKMSLEHKALRGGLPLGQLHLGGGLDRLHVLPFQPILPGFLINSVLYAMLVWGLAASLRALRTRRRLKRRLCPACAYPIGTSPVCTECGALLPLRPGGALECSHG